MISLLLTTRAGLLASSKSRLSGPPDFELLLSSKSLAVETVF